MIVLQYNLKIMPHVNKWYTESERIHLLLLLFLFLLNAFVRHLLRAEYKTDDQTLPVFINSLLTAHSLHTSQANRM